MRRAVGASRVGATLGGPWGIVRAYKREPRSYRALGVATLLDPAVTGARVCLLLRRRGFLYAALRGMVKRNQTG